MTLAFASGFGILVLEIAGARMLADTYGLSSIPWTAVIAVVLTGLAVGNTVGGFAADRGRDSLVPLFLIAALWTIVPMLGSRLPEIAMRNLGFAGGALATAATFLLIPALVMGAVTPILVERTTLHVDEVGLRFGNVGAWSTAGAIVGTVAAGFLLLPALPLRLVLALVCGLFFLCSALAGTIEQSRVTTVLAAAATPLPLLLALLAAGDDDVVFAGQSVHSSMRVVDSYWFGEVPVREFWQNGSLSSAEHRVTGEPTQYYKITAGWLLAERLERIDSVLVLGGAANTLPTQLKRMRPELHVTVVEIDPKAVRVARDFFSFGRLEPGAIEVHISDARPFLRNERRLYDVILLDVYDHLYSVPWPLVTREAFLDVEARLKAGGLMTITLSTPLTGPGTPFLARVVATLESVFPEVRIYLTRPDIDPRATQEVLVAAVRDEADFPAAEWPWISIPPAGAPLRDDFAPVEFLQAIRFMYDPAW
jgi:spermidine synthase